jgi:membrane protein implicated in regulation of membrane protease activity
VPHHSDRYGPDVLAQPRRARRAVPEVAAEPDLVVETADGGFCGAVVELGQAVDAGEKRDTVTLEDRRGRRRVFALLPAAFLLDGAPVTLVRPASASTASTASTAPTAPTAPAARRKTASGSFAVPAAPARVARASRIWVEGIHDAALLERIWGDDLRVEGVVVEPLDGIDHLVERVHELRPAPQRRVGVLVDHLVAGSKESRIVAALRDNPHVLVTGHPYVDVWQAVKPTALGITAWPVVPRDVAPGTGRGERLCRRRGAAAARGGGADRLRDGRLVGATCHDGGMPDWLIWMIVAGVLAAAETASLAFILIMVAGGAAAAALTAALGGPVALQVVVAILGTVTLLWLVRPVAVRHTNSGPPHLSGSSALVGRDAVVLSAVSGGGGRVRLNGGEWSARAIDPEQVLAVGTHVTVLAIDGATAVVWRNPLD